MARLLLVEDDPLVRHHMNRLLQAAGHEVQAVPTGEAAMALVETFPPELVILDVGLPGMSGIECARRLRRARHDAPLLFLTADESADVVKEAIELGAHAYMVKPVSGAQLLPLVASALAAAMGVKREHERMLGALRDSREISAAVGVLAERNGWSVDKAFQALRTMARSSERKITEVAADVLAGSRSSGDGENSSR